MKKIYLVWGSSGEYDDYQDWVVCAYTKKLDAEAHVKKAQDKVRYVVGELKLFTKGKK